MAIDLRASGATANTQGNTTSVPITIPAAVLEGDLMLVQVGNNQATKTVSHDGAPGWIRIGTTLISTAHGGVQDTAGSWWGRIATATDPGTTYTFTTTVTPDTATYGMTIQLMTVFGHDPTNWLNAFSGAASPTVGDILRYKAITPTVNDCLIVPFAHTAGEPDVTNLVAPTGTTEVIESGTGTALSSNRRGHLSYQLLTGGANVEIAEKTSVPEGLNHDTITSVAGMIAIAPSAVPVAGTLGDLKPDTIIAQDLQAGSHTLTELQEDIA